MNEINSRIGKDSVLSQLSTKELVDELIKREGVDSVIAEPYEDVIVKAIGPATILVVTD